MRKSALAAAAVAAIIHSSASAKEVQQLDEACIGRETIVCGLAGSNANGVIAYADQQRRLRTGNASQRAQASTWFNSMRAGIVNQAATMTADSQTLERCNRIVRAYHDCVVTIDIPTADEMRTAIRESNDAVLKAWLAALDARGTPQ